MLSEKILDDMKNDFKGTEIHPLIKRIGNLKKYLCVKIGFTLKTDKIRKVVSLKLDEIFEQHYFDFKKFMGWKTLKLKDAVKFIENLPVDGEIQISLSMYDGKELFVYENGYKIDGYFE